MLEEILTDHVANTASTTGSIFSTAIDYAEELKKRDEATKKWASFSAEERASFQKIELFFANEKIIDFKDASVLSAKNYYVLQREINARLESNSSFQQLPIDSLYFNNQLMELLEHIENVAHIKELYKLRKKTVGSTKNAGIATDEAQRIKNCMRQGRELYIAGKQGSLMVKPLNLFYALTAYAYAIIILNNPIRYSLDGLPGSHGINFLPDPIKTQFGGGSAQGTFSDLFCSFPTLSFSDNSTGELTQDCQKSILAFYNSRFTTSMGTLLSMIPEIRDYYKLITGNRSRAHPLEVAIRTEARSIKWKFHIGDGETRPSVDDVESAFPEFDISEQHGRVIVTVPSTEIYKVKACIYSDVRNKLWYIENPFFPVILPETCVHFLLSNSFSNIMRYSPDRWGDILLNEANSNVSLIARKYLSAFESKFPFLILRSVSKFYPFVES